MANGHKVSAFQGNHADEGQSPVLNREEVTYEIKLKL
jgi:hypothetical protein